MKTIIFITGATTIGKSILAHVLGTKLFEPRIHIIPLKSSRLKREDDDPKFILQINMIEKQNILENTDNIHEVDFEVSVPNKIIRGLKKSSILFGIDKGN